MYDTTYVILFFVMTIITILVVIAFWASKQWDLEGEKERERYERGAERLE